MTEAGGGGASAVVVREETAADRDAGVTGAGLGPMAVRPGHQRTGIGSALVREGLERCRRRGVDLVVVLGHPEYYPRFGFAAASRLGLRCQFDVPDEVFMALELTPGGAAKAGGFVRYASAFGPG